MSLNLFIIGPSGCGKSTQAKLIAEKYQLTHLSMGQLLRDEISQGSSQGLEAKTYLDQGQLVPEQLTYEVISKFLPKINHQNFIIDGFPRTLTQGQFVEKYLTDNGQPLDLIIHLDVTFEEIQLRRDKMGINFQDKKRTDSTPQAIASRQQFYNDNNSLIMDYFDSKKLLFRTDGSRSIEAIFKDITQKINSLLKSNS